MSTSAPGSRTIERALRVLDSFTGTEQRWRTSRLAEHCGLPVPTTHRILRVLESYGYVERDPGSGAFSLGPSAAGLAREEPLLAEIRGAGVPGALRKLQLASGHCVSLSLLSEARDHRLEAWALSPDGDEALAEDRVAPEARPLHAGASSKALLAQMSGDELGPLLDRALPRVGPSTITSSPRLRREVVAIRRRGWAFSREETSVGRWELAVPVAGAGRTACALALSAPLADFDSDRARRRLAALTIAARALTARLLDGAAEPLAAGGSGMRARRHAGKAGRPGPPEPPRGDARWQTA